MSYRGPALNAVLGALLEIDAKQEAAFQIRQGDMLLHTLAYTISGVDFDPGEKTAITSIKQQADDDLYRTLIWDFCDSLGERWHALDLDLLARKLGRIDVSIIGLSSLDPAQRSEIDARLQSVEHYLGGFDPDPGNPIHGHVTDESLIHACDYLEGSLLFNPWDSEDPFDPPQLNPHGEAWFDGLQFNEVRYMTEAEVADQSLVPRWPRGITSTRGEQSALLLRERRRGGHLAEIAEMASRPSFAKDSPPFSIDVTAMSNPADAVVEEQKLTAYVLNPDHEDGGDKARWFSAALGIQREDWRHLASQLRLGLPHSTPEEIRSTPFGLRYSVVTTVGGINKAVARVKSVWEIGPNAPPRLVTAHPAKREDDLPDAPPALVLGSSLTGNARWSALWELADGHATEAAARVIPTPMNVDGHWYPEGAFGFATVGVRDARRGFARWLRLTKGAYLATGRGAVIHAPGSMIDRARAYADSFFEVLQFNGIEGDVRWRLD